MTDVIQILLVDDDVKNSMLLKKFLEVEGSPRSARPHDRPHPAEDRRHPRTGLGADRGGAGAGRVLGVRVAVDAAVDGCP